MRRHLTVQEQAGIAVRAVRRIKEGTSAVLLRSGLDEKMVGGIPYLRNIQGLSFDGRTLYERRFGEQFKGPIIPIGSLVEYHPISAKDLSRLHMYGKKVLPGIFLGYVLYTGRMWKGDTVVADVDDLAEMDASESRRWRKSKVIWRRSGSQERPP